MAPAIGFLGLTGPQVFRIPGDRNTYRYTNPHSDSDTDGDSHAHANCAFDTNSHSYLNPDSNTNAAGGHNFHRNIYSGHRRLDLWRDLHIAPSHQRVQREPSAIERDEHDRLQHPRLRPDSRLHYHSINSCRLAYHHAPGNHRRLHTARRES